MPPTTLNSEEPVYSAVGFVQRQYGVRYSQPKVCLHTTNRSTHAATQTP